MRSGDSNRSLARLVVGCALAAMLALALSSCGGGSGEATAGGVDGGTTTTAQAAPAKPVKEAGKPSAAAAGTCSGQLREFLNSMASLRSDLVAGLSYQEYLAEVQSSRTAYRRVPVDELTLGCLQAAGTPGESGLNKYIAASNTWTECIETPDCESAAVEPALQSRWRQASKRLSEAQRGLKELTGHPSHS